MSPSWYDLLGVEPSAGGAEVRAAWKASIADLDPSDRRFRLRNQAAEVLLDPTRRAAYDAELALEEPEPEPEPESELEPEPVPPVSLAKPAEEAEEAGSSAAPVPAAAARRGVPGWLLVGLAALTAVMVGVSAWLWVKVPADQTVADATVAAQAAAERAIVPVLSYDYRDMAKSQATAHRYMSASYRKDYDSFFSVLADNAPNTQTVVTTRVVASGVVRSGADRVQVILFVNRPTANAQQKTPVDYKDQVTVTMVDDGGEWLVDALATTPVQS